MSTTPADVAAARLDALLASLEYKLGPADPQPVSQYKPAKKRKRPNKRKDTRDPAQWPDG